MNSKSLYSICVLLLILSIGCTPKPFKEPGIRASSSVEPGAETSITLEDGAAILIPDTSMEGTIEVLIERNPEKAAELSPIPDNFLPLSQFYNFAVTSGTLAGPVDLVIPFDSDRIPEEAGELVILIPTADGWTFRPVTTDGSKATYYTLDPGDPLIAWHFADFKKGVDERYADPAYQRVIDCSNSLSVSVYPERGDYSTEFHVYVRYDNANGRNADIPLKFTYNYWVKGISGNTSTAETDGNGFFDLTVRPTDTGLGFKDGLNGVRVDANCGAGGWTASYIHWKVDPAAADSAQPAVVQVPAEITQPSDSQPPSTVITPERAVIPAGAVQLPDFRGRSLEEATEWLNANKFKYIWVDGSSVYDLGMLYGQAPAGGTYQVPHRTTVLLYRTTAKVDPEITLTAKSSGPHGECTLVSWSVVAPGISDLTLEDQSVAPTGSQEYCPSESTTITLKLYTANGLLKTADQIIQVRPMLTLDRTYFCRKGPKSSYSDVLDFPAGTILPIIGRSTNGWWLVEINDSRTSHTSCWIGGGQASGDTGALPVTEAQASTGSNPTATSTPAPYPGP